MQAKYARLVPAVLIIFLVAYTLFYVITSDKSKKGQIIAQPQNIVVMIADGFGPGALSLYRNWKNLPVLPIDHYDSIGMMYTEAKNNFVTDSAAAATAMATSVSTNQKMVGVDSDGHPIINIAEAAKSLGKSVGLISTNTVSDATPAGFAAHTKNRWAQEQIHLQYLKQDYDVILGGGRKYWLPPKRKDKKNVIKMAQAQGYEYVSDAQSLATASGKKILGLFHKGYMSFKVDRKPGCLDANSKEPSLKEMTMKAIEVLAKNPKGFFLMSEGARVDHAGHALDVPAMMIEIEEFYEALEAVQTWAQARGDTLVVVLSDHDTMGVMPNELTQYEKFKEIKCSTNHHLLKIRRDAKGRYIRKSIVEVLNQHGIPNPTESEIALIMKSNDLPFYKAAAAVGQVINERFHIGALPAKYNWLTSSAGHTSIPITVFAKGPGESLFRGVYKNSEVGKKLGRLMNYEGIGKRITRTLVAAPTK